MGDQPLSDAPLSDAPLPELDGDRLLLYTRGGMIEVFPQEDYDLRHGFDTDLFDGEWILARNSVRDPVRIRTSEIMVAKVWDGKVPEPDDGDGPGDAPAGHPGTPGSYL